MNFQIAELATFLKIRKYLPLLEQFWKLDLRLVFQYVCHMSSQIQPGLRFSNVLWSHRIERNEKRDELGDHNIG